MTSSSVLPNWVSTLKPEEENKPAWLSDLQQKEWQAFLETGIPTRQHERYKYTDLNFLKQVSLKIAAKRDEDDLYDAIHQQRLRLGESALVVLVNGYFIPALSDLHKIPHEVIISSLSDAIKNHEALVQPHLLKALDAKRYPLASLNDALFRDGLFFYLPANKALSAPVHLLHFSIGEDDFISHPHHVWVLGENSQLKIVEEYVAFNERAYFNNIVTEITVDSGAVFTYYKIQQESKQATHMAQTVVHQHANSQTRFLHFSHGAKFSRDDLLIKLMETGASCRANGYYHACDRQYVDYHLDILHLAPRSESEMLYKGILNHEARAVFNGRLYVEKDSQKITAYQANHNLLLANESEVYSKPELEIYADDVKCKHGATVGQLNTAALFYLQSRGIPKEEAMHILLKGFAEEIMSRIDHPGILARIEEVML